MKRRFLTVTAVPDEDSQKILRALCKQLPEENADSSVCATEPLSITVGSFRRFRRRGLIKKISSAAQGIHGFKLTLKEWKSFGTAEIRLIPEPSPEMEQLRELFDGSYADSTPWTPYIAIPCKAAEKTADHDLTPVTIVISALELDAFSPREKVLMEKLLPIPEERSMPKEKADEIDLSEVMLKDLQPSQFYVSEDKLRKAEEWFNPEDLSNFEPISVKKLDGKLVMLDGHTRAVAALNAGLDRVPLIWETEEWDWEMYRRCVHECEQRDVLSPTDLVPRVISAEEYWEKWDAWCDRMQAEVEAARKA